MDEQLFPRQGLVLSVTWWPGVEIIARCQHFNCCVITIAMMPRMVSVLGSELLCLCVVL